MRDSSAQLSLLRHSYFLAFLLERTLEFKLKEAQEKASPEEIREALNSLNFAEVEMENQK
ncbi:MAG: hypothetical protein PWP57_715, partial [Candidatus Atribacteria bacterium]|nr:hypothetical protein [Candidatus Atribacteria bacterium]